MYYNPNQWQGMPQGFGGTPSYPVFVQVPMPSPDGQKPPSTKPMSPKRMFKEMLAAQKSWEEFQKTGGKKIEEKKPDDKPKIPMYTLNQVLLVLWALSIPVGFLSLYLYVQIAKTILPQVGFALGVR